jgi:putative PEP-CTERM system histidine kinase
VNSESIMPFVAAGLSLLLATAGIFWKRNNLGSWCFALGMCGFAADAILSGLALRDTDLIKLEELRDAGLAVKGGLTAVWLCFSTIYSRGDAKQSLRRWSPLIILSAILPPALVLAFPGALIQGRTNPETGESWLVFGGAARIINLIVLIGTVLILMNLERTFRAAVGTMQWRIKFLILGLAVIFGARIYTRSQVLVFSGHANSLTQVETIALLIGYALMAVAYARSGFAEIDVYPSRAVLHTSITVLLAGGYLLVVGVLAQIVERSGGAGVFQLEAFLVLVAIALLAVLLLSERLRHRIKSFVSHHFKRPHYDFRKIWTRFTESTESAMDDRTLCAAAAQLISQTFNVLSVSIWIYDEEKERLERVASTARSRGDTAEQSIRFSPPRDVNLPRVFDLETVKQEWGERFRELNETQFHTGGPRIGTSLVAGERWLGVTILADRVSGIPYTLEEFELLECIGDQIASNLLNLRLTNKILLGKELEAFQTISAFFVHDLKNAASTLNLMLQNFPVHYADPAFRADALRGIGETTSRINQIIDRLSAVRDRLELQPGEVDLNEVVNQVVQGVNGSGGIEVSKSLESLPRLQADAEQLRSVVTNLLLNAHEAVGRNGRIEVKTAEHDGWVTLSVVDNGCGMPPEFVRDSLFRPFKTTKKKGLGIGMFQTKMIVEAHHGVLRVQSEPGKGTAFHVSLPLHSP